MPSADQATEVPSSFPSVLPPNPVADARAIVGGIEKSIDDIKTDVRDIRSSERSHFLWLISALAGGFVLACAISFAVYSRLDDRIEKLTQSNIRVETKLEDLLLRIPPAVTPAPRRQ